MWPGVGMEGWLRWFAHPFVVLSAAGREQLQAFAPNTQFLLPALQKWQLGFFCLLYLLGPEFAPTGNAHSYF